jgi:hypothetical protein
MRLSGLCSISARASTTGSDPTGRVVGRIVTVSEASRRALEDWLHDQGVKNISNVNNALTAAKPWFSFYGAASAAALA